ncbi:MAG: thioredoxin [Nanoarchaeota archaeon]|nr:thioredoxin [Nanoarchaeota archaeon]
MEEINQENFQEKVHHSEKPVLVDFWSEECQPCIQLAPVLERVAENYKDKLNFYKINIAGNAEIFTEHGVRSVPTLIIFKNGSPASESVGFKDENFLSDWIEENL